MNTELDILFLPKWYPYEGDPFDGNFVENHAHAIKGICNLSVLFVHSSEIEQESLYRFEEKDNEGIRELRVFFKKANTPIGLLNRLIHLKRYKKAQELAYQRLYPSRSPDLIHIHVLARSALLALKLKKKGIPFVITEHWSGYLPESGALKASGKTVLYSRIGRQAKGIHTVTQKLAKAMQAHGINNEYTVIPNVVKEDLFVPLEKGGREQIKILYVGNILQHPKRILDIIECFQKIREERSDFVLDIYGEGVDLKQMQDKIEQYKLTDHIHYQGTSDRAGIAKVMAEADFLFLFSEFENQPCVINEALCCGTPVVVPNIEGIEEFMREDFGIVFQRLDPTAFISAILRMMDSYTGYSSEKIREEAVKEFGEAAISKKFLEFYESALSR